MICIIRRSISKKFMIILKLMIYCNKEYTATYMYSIDCLTYGESVMLFTMLFTAGRNDPRYEARMSYKLPISMVTCPVPDGIWITCLNQLIKSTSGIAAAHHGELSRICTVQSACVQRLGHYPEYKELPTSYEHCASPRRQKFPRACYQRLSAISL